MGQAGNRTVVVTWVKLDDHITEHRKFVGLSPAGWTLWIHGLTYSSRNLTDGHIPAAIITRLAPVRNATRVASELVERGLWELVDNGWLVHDYCAIQRSSVQVRAEMERGRVRKSRSRSRQAAPEAPGNIDDSADVTVMSQRDIGRSHADVTVVETETETETDVPTSVVTASARYTRPAALEAAAEEVSRRRGRPAEAATKGNPEAWLASAVGGIRSELIAAGAHQATHQGATVAQLADLIEPRPSVPASESRVLSIVDRLATVATCNTCHGTRWDPDPDLPEARPCPDCTQEQ